MNYLSPLVIKLSLASFKINSLKRVLFIYALFSLLSSTHASSLKETFIRKFKIGVAINNQAQLSPSNKVPYSLIQKQFNSLVAENQMKWKSINPKPGIYKFDKVDALIEFAEKNQMQVVGHVLFWHNQTPAWVFQDDQGKTISKAALLKRMRLHIRTLHQRYGDKIQVWDVVNEALEEDGSMRKSPWSEILGPDWVSQAFKIAQEELPPSTQLIYNDYGLYHKKKLNGLSTLIKSLQDQNIRIDAIGVQGHWSLKHPSLGDIDRLFTTIENRGLKIHISELDVDVLPRPKKFSGGAETNEHHDYLKKLDPFRSGLPEKNQIELAQRYSSLFKLFLNHSESIQRVTFWGLNDAVSWKNNFPVPKRVNYPLLFNRNLKPKKAYFQVIDSIKPTLTKNP